MILRLLGVPVGFLSVVETIYLLSAAFFRTAGVFSTLLLYYLGAVLQGCPLSALLFLFSIDPFLEALAAVIPKQKGMIRACADDISVTISDLHC